MANSIASTLQIYGTINEDELLFFFDIFGKPDIFPFSAQARKILPETPWFRSLPVARQRQMLRDMKNFPLWSEASRVPQSESFAGSSFSFSKKDVISQIFEEDFSTVDDPFVEEMIVLPRKSTFVSFQFDLPGYKNRISQGIPIRIQSRNSLRKQVFGPFTFDQYIAMAVQFIEDLQNILINAPPLRKELIL